MVKRQPEPDLNPDAAFAAVESGRVELGSLSRIQQEAYHAERRRRLAELAADDDNRDAARRAAARRAAEQEAVADYHRQRERQGRKSRHAKRRRALRVDAELLSDFAFRQSFATMSAAMVGAIRAALESFLGSLSGRRPMLPPPADREIVLPPAPEYSAAEVRATLAEYRERIRQLKALVARIPELPGRTPRDIAAVAIEYLDYKLNGVGGESPFRGPSRRFFAAVNAADTETAQAWRSELDRALSGGARCLRELREIDAIGAKLDEFPELGRPLPGLLPPPTRRHDNETPATDISNESRAVM